MRHTITPILIVRVVLSTVGQGNVVAQSSSSSVARLSLARARQALLLRDLGL